MVLGKWVTWWVAVPLACLGCSKSGEGEVRSVGSTQELAAEMARLVCSSRAACCQEQSFELDEARCVDDYQARLLASAWQEGERLGGKLDPALASACLTAVKAAVVCGELDDDVYDLDACEDAVHGNVTPGEPCQSRLECALAPGQGSSCGESGRCSVHAEVQAERGRQGEPCRTTCENERCLVAGAQTPAAAEDESRVGCYRSDGLYCAAGEETCRPLLTLDEPCGLDGECADGLYCGGDTVDAFVCKTKLENGADCFLAPPACESGYCDEETWLCQEQPGLSAEDCNDYQ